MICGGTGAGKSTYAAGLAADMNAVRLSIDEWLHRLYFVDRPPTDSFEWFYERVQRIGAQMRDVGDRVIEAGRPVIFDCGFTNSRERQIYYDWADDMGHSVSLHFVDTPVDLRWARTQQRNSEKGPTFMFEVDRGMFDFVETMWEAPDQAELAARGGIHHTG